MLRCWLGVPQTTGNWRERWGATLWIQLWNLSVHTDRAAAAGGGFVSAHLPEPESPVGRPQGPGASSLHAEGALLHLHLQKQRRRPGWLCPPHTRGHHRGLLPSAQHRLHSWHHTRRAEDTGPPRGVHRPARRHQRLPQQTLVRLVRNLSGGPLRVLSTNSEKVEEKPHPDTQFCLCTILNQSNLARGQTTPQGQMGKRGLRRRKKVIAMAPGRTT